MRAAGLVLVAWVSVSLLSGCNHVQLNGGSLYIQTGPALVAALGVAVLAANVDARNDFSSGTMPGADQPVPKMLADRVVAEQDCTKPIEDWSANLKCR
ncbi:MAG TPA: hypothetical protein VEU32_22235 [Burkholderiales bacterium]|nr:hypothetical protein [Burkholderiales bacterium]